MDLFEGLNPAQRAAVTFYKGPLLVLAGPGSGKTRVITHRVAHLIHRGVAAERVLAVTFTNKAAEEMRRRTLELVPGQRPVISTFHRLAARFLRRLADRIGRSADFTILDASDRVRMLEQCLREMGESTQHFPAGTLDRRIGQLKSDLVGPPEARSRATRHEDEIVAEVYARYASRLLRANALDFDDLLLSLAELMKSDAPARTWLAEQFDFVLVDEYQDTNLAQYAIARGLALAHGNLCVTGDPDQAIYGWRGANIDNIIHFERDYPGALIVRLEENYRSTGHILAVADSLIRVNTQRHDKALTTGNPMGKQVVVCSYRDEHAEARGIADTIRERVDSGARTYQDIAIFLRTTSLARPIEATLRERRIPFQLIGGTPFFERKEIRDVLAYGRAVLNPRDDLAIERIVNVPPRGIGATTLGRLRDRANREGISLRAALDRLDECPAIRGRQRTALGEFRQVLDGLRDLAEMDADLAIAHILEASGYAALLEETSEENVLTRRRLDDLLDSARGFRQEQGLEGRFPAFLESLSLSSDTDAWDASSNRVSVMTFHSAKGLEFPVVFLAAFEKGILPHERHPHERDEEEERRLAFVGMTRAREELLISYAGIRHYQGIRGIRSPSHFLLGLPKQSVERLDLVPTQVSTDEGAAIDDVSQENPYEEPVIRVLRGAHAPSPSDGYQVGMRIRHSRYGTGTIVDLDGVGADRHATIRFASGAKRFVLAHAPIEPLDVTDDFDEFADPSAQAD